MSSLGHSWQVFTTALSDDRARRRTVLQLSESEFLPAALEVTERPVSPTARATTWVLLVGLAATIAWLALGRVDIVASAPGKLIPTGNVKLVQAAGSGVVRVIYVRDGDIVYKGQPLLDLDPTLSGADLAEAQKGLAAAELDMARDRAIADALGGATLSFHPPQGTDPAITAIQRRLIAAELADVQATSTSLAAARVSALSDAEAARAQMGKLAETVPILDREVEAMNRLDKKGYAPGLKLLELQRQRRAETGDRDIAVAQEAKALADARKLGAQSIETHEQARHTALVDLAKAQADAILRREEVTKASRKSGLQRLVAPENGTVQQLAVHTIGGVVEPARTLMIVVPSGSGLEVEAKLLNKDAGFVHVGQPVAVKLEAYPFTRYGTVAGRINGVSRDAVADSKLGSVYNVRITLERNIIVVDGRDIVLSPGLAATADIRTGSRRIITYLLSPLQTATSQAGRER